MCFRSLSASEKCIGFNAYFFFQVLIKICLVLGFSTKLTCFSDKKKIVTYIILTTSRFVGFCIF